MDTQVKNPTHQTLKTKIKRFKEFLGYHILTPLRVLMQKILKSKNIIVLYRLSGGIGDTFIITAIIESVYKRYGAKCVVFTKYPEFFVNSPHIVQNINYNSTNKHWRGILKSALKYMRSSQIICIGGESWTMGTWPWEPHIADFIDTNWASGLNPDKQIEFDAPPKAVSKIYFNESEIALYSQKFDLPNKFFVVKATIGITEENKLIEDRHDGANRKEFGIKNMQYIIDNINDIKWIQIGQKNEAKLSGCVDLIGKCSLRETLFILSKANAILTIEGFINHAAAAFNIPTFTVYLGNTDDYESLVYANNIKIVANPMPECAPCWSVNCIQPEKYCLTQINKDLIVTQIKNLI